jgi:hypothetical protein
MAGFVRFLLIAFLIYLVAVLFLRYVFPFILRLFVRRMSDNVRKQYEKEQQKTEKKKGDITIDYTPKSKKKIDKDTGDYVPFEEIDD